MIAQVYDCRKSIVGEWAGKLEALPTCGEDFCDTCGDCLACYGSDPCPGGEHLWVVEYPGSHLFRLKGAI